MDRLTPGDQFRLATSYGGFFEDLSEEQRSEREVQEAHDAENQRRQEAGLPSIEQELAQAERDAWAATQDNGNGEEEEKGWWASLPPAAAATLGIGGGVVGLLLLVAIFRR